MIARRFVFFALFICMTIGSFCETAGAQTISEVKRRSKSISDRDLLGISKRLTANAGSLLAPQDTRLRVLAIRVDFQEDNNPLTTGNGKFQLAPDAEKTIDAPPHNRTYFEHQMRAVSNYFETVSSGNLLLEYDVFPQDAEISFTVSQPMSHYAPAGNETLLDLRLAELFQESFQVADASGTIDFSQYDIFLIFHAGVGSDFSLDFDATPQDIPSLFLSFNELKQQLANNDPGYTGVSVNGGATFIRDGIILPETQSQEGIEIGLLGTAAIMFGGQLGLPILFNPDNGRSGIGVFGLMDQGSGNFFGLIPAQPCAWSKVYLGWETPITVTNGSDLPVAASGAVNSSRIYKIPISASEYFLLENRNRDINGDNIAIGRDENGTRVEFHWDENGQQILAEAAPGVITQVSEYDFGLPGSGILIWHIDENVIAQNLAANRINADPTRRGVDLEEADGAQDIGQFYGFLSPGAGAENGVLEDMFWGGNEINMLVNGDSPVVQFTPTTTPNSNSNSGANSHISLTNFSEPDSIMFFSVSNDIVQAGFPVSFAETRNEKNAPVVADLNRDGNNEIIFLASESAEGGAGKLYIWSADGSPFLQVGAVAAQPEGQRSFSAAVANAGQVDVVIVATDLAVTAYLPQDVNAVPGADVLFSSSFQSAITTHPMILPAPVGGGSFAVIVGTENGEVYQVDDSGAQTLLAQAGQSEVVGLALMTQNRIVYLSANGALGVTSESGMVWQTSLSGAFSNSPVVSDLNHDTVSDIVVISDDGTVFAHDENSQTLPGFPRSAGRPASSDLALADFDDDGFVEILYFSAQELVALNSVGSLKNGFPLSLQSDSYSAVRSSIPATPVVADINDDGKFDLVAGSDRNRLEAFDKTGNSLSGFPLPADAAITATPTIADIDNDGDMEVLAVTSGGALYVWDLPGTYQPDRILWGTFLADARHSNSNFKETQNPQTGGQLMPSDQVYNYPNPTSGNATTIRYKLNEPAQVNIRIFDLAGEFVDELTGTGFGQFDNEVTWQLDNIQSGVYLARVEATGASSKDIAIIKIAVVK